MKTTLHIAPADYKRLTDEELVHRYAHRHENIALSYLFDRYAHLVLGICMKHFDNAAQAKTVTNELFIMLTDDLKRYTIEQFKPWLFQYVKNYCTIQTNETVPVANNTIIIDTDMKFDNDKVNMDTEKLSLLLEEEMKGLSNDERTCIEMFYLKNMAYAQIANATGWQLSQVKHFIQEGKYHLKTKLVA